MSAVEIPWQEMGVADAATLEAYAQASGDLNPIHRDESRARAMGLPGVIAHGMLSAGWLAERARRFLAEKGADGLAPGAPVKWLSMRTRFKDMTLRDERVECGGRIQQTAPGKWVMDLTARTLSGKTTSDCRIEISQ